MPPGGSALVADSLEHRQQVLAESRRILRHGEMPHLGHHLEMGRADLRRELTSHLRGRGGVVLSAQQIDRAPARVDAGGGAVAEIPVLEVVVQVADEDPRAALHVVPHRLPALRRGGLGRHHTVHERARDLAAVGVGTMQDPPGRVLSTAGRVDGVVGGLEADHGPQRLGVAEREMEHDAAPDRASHDHRPLEVQGPRHPHHGIHVGICRQLVDALLVAVRRGRLAVQGQVEGNDPEVAGDVGIVQHRTVLAGIGPGGVEAQQGNALARFLEVDSVRLAADVEVQVAPGDGLDPGRARGRLRRRAVTVGRGQQHLEEQQVLMVGKQIALDRQVPAAAHGGERLEAGAWRLALVLSPGGGARPQHDVGCLATARADSYAFGPDVDQLARLAGADLHLQRPVAAAQRHRLVLVRASREMLEHLFQSISISSTVATNDEDALMALHEMSNQDLKKYNADWGASFFFQPKKMFSSKKHGKMIALFKEDRGMVIIFYLFNEPSEEVDLQKYCLSFLAKEEVE